MSPQLEAPPSRSESEADVPDTDFTTDTESHRSTTEAAPSEHTRPSLREVVLFGSLFVGYVAALTAIGVFRAVRWLLQLARNQQTA